MQENVSFMDFLRKWKYLSLGITVLEETRQSLITRVNTVIPRDGSFDLHLKPMKVS